MTIPLTKTFALHVYGDRLIGLPRRADFFAKGKGQAVFSAARNVVCIRKWLAHRGKKSPSEVGALYGWQTARINGIGLFTNRPGTWRTDNEKTAMKKRENVPRTRGRGGRPIKNDPAIHRYSVNLTAEEHARFLTLFEQSGLLSKSLFIKARVFDRSFRVIKSDEGTLEFVAKLTAFHSQFRHIGVNYNQVVKELHTHFSEKKALALLCKLERITAELVIKSERIIGLTEEFKRRWWPE